MENSSAKKSEYEAHSIQEDMNTHADLKTEYGEKRQIDKTNK
jgi:hypothetical protein